MSLYYGWLLGTSRHNTITYHLYQSPTCTRVAQQVTFDSSLLLSHEHSRTISPPRLSSHRMVLHGFLDRTFLVQCMKTWHNLQQQYYFFHRRHFGDTLHWRRTNERTILLHTVMTCLLVSLRMRDRCSNAWDLGNHAEHRFTRVISVFLNRDAIFGGGLDPGCL